MWELTIGDVGGVSIVVGIFDIKEHVLVGNLSNLMLVAAGAILPAAILIVHSAILGLHAAMDFCARGDFDRLHAKILQLKIERLVFA